MPSTSAKPRMPRGQRKPKNAFALPERAPDAAPAPEFAPVPRQYYRHDGWTPERQRAFIGALADTGCVRRAARMVNMAQTNCYTLRRAPGAEEFRRAWDAALDCGLKRLKDIAFERAIEGELIPVFAGGKLMGFRRKRNDALLMFVLRHYGQDASGKRTTIDYFSSRASASAGTGAGQSGAGAAAEASATTVRAVVTGAPGVGPSREAEAAAAVEQFAGVTLDAEAHAAIMTALKECAARSRAADEALGEEAADWAEDDPEEPFVRLPHNGNPYRGTLDPPMEWEEIDLPEGEGHWTNFGAPLPDWAQKLPALAGRGDADVDTAPAAMASGAAG